mmetsp:Transcript_88736/g.249926  ORF Transcript_88736/g.249926 Transcript_88736/m.249926 type:complete len:321 (-) Transcript_88736:129-1091(-)|eukprot:CAMPEP_0117503282 /NCGR_PEP_ID=MMETSP0784-20121206/24248_1 /TAXON_ID=39447 /ORGANISM="" /LENGTH=320 /DNA_ID=CAMNT_0005298591 /DNA_START=87 /DNA_END=1049 /DNA_ORIENTATION=+
MGNKCSGQPCCSQSSPDELTEFNGGVDELVDSKVTPILQALDDGFTNDSRKISEEFAADESYDRNRGGLIRTYFDKEYDELAGTTVVDPGIQEERPAYTFSTGARYEGQWQGSHRHGFGCQIWPDGASYKGQWRKDKAFGHGGFSYKTGSTSYIGQWKHNMAHGLGVARQPDHVYAGKWVDDFQTGIGIESWTDGSKFEGEFLDGTKHGFGVYTWPDGSIQEGSWKNGVMDGTGVFFGKDGKVLRGTWVEDRKTGAGFCLWKDGRSYKGQYEEDQKHGFGVFEWPDGASQKCYWIKGQPQKPPKKKKSMLTEADRTKPAA